MLLITNVAFLGIPVTTGKTVEALKEGRHGDVPRLGVMMLRIDPWLTLWACLPYPTIALLGRAFGKRVYKTSQAVQAQLGSLSNEIQEDLTSIQAIKSYGLEGVRKERFRASSQKLLEK